MATPPHLLQHCRATWLGHCKGPTASLILFAPRSWRRLQRRSAQLGEVLLQVTALPASLGGNRRGPEPTTGDSFTGWRSQLPSSWAMGDGRWHQPWRPPCESTHWVLGMRLGEGGPHVRGGQKGMQ